MNAMEVIEKLAI